MTDEQALLARVLASPGDDLPRLVYADHLDDSGDGGRAEFVRLQIRAEELRGGYEWAIIRNKMMVAWLENWRAITVGLPAEQKNLMLGVPGVCSLRQAGCWEYRYEFRRGMVTEFEGLSAVWLQHADAVLAHHPVAAVRLTDRPRLIFRDDGTQLDGLPFVLPYREGPSLPFAGDGQVYRTRWHPTAEELLAARWPGVAFELPPAFTERPRDMDGRFVGVDFASVTGERLYTNEDAVASLRSWQVVMYGDGSAEPLGIIEADDRTARLPRTTRRDSIPARWQPRFPRPR